MEINILIKLLLSSFLGGLIGLERQSHNKNSGLRTMALISLGACIFSIISLDISGADSSRVIAQIVTGIGFLGAGIIFKSGTNVYGLTTAATICTAGIGVLIGVDMFEIAIYAVLAILIINSLNVKIKKKKIWKK